MKISSLETTPNPNCMKLNLDEQIVTKPVSLERGKTLENLPDAVNQLLNIKGVREAFVATNFITLIRQSNADWQPILSKAARLLGVVENAEIGLLTKTEESASLSTGETRQNLGEVEIAVLVFRGIPVQVRVLGEQEQARVNLPERFNEALQRALQATGSNYIEERHWEPYPSRNGQPEEVANMLAEEVASLIDAEELARLEKAAIASAEVASHPASPSTAPSAQKASQPDLLAQLHSTDWQQRLKAIQKLEANPNTFSALVQALNDDKAAIRRWAAALLGASGMSEAVEPLGNVVLNDSSVIVRRTAGDALSDLGDTSAISTLCKSLEDGSKLVRWRAARFLNETGDETAIEALERAIERENEFDVRLEMKAALERISSGGERQLPMWMRLSQSEG